MQREMLFPLVRRKAQQLLNGYVHSPQILESIDHYIVPPALGNQSGVLGAIALARDSIETSFGEDGSLQEQRSCDRHVEF